MRIVHIPVTGDLEELNVAQEDMYATVKRLLNDATFTIATTHRNHFMYVDDDGLMKQLEVNNTASLVYNIPLEFGQPIVGPAVLVGPVDGEGDETDVDDVMLDYVKSIHAAVRKSRTSAKTLEVASGD